MILHPFPDPLSISWSLITYPFHDPSSIPWSFIHFMILDHLSIPWSFIHSLIFYPFLDPWSHIHSLTLHPFHDPSFISKYFILSFPNLINFFKILFNQVKCWFYIYGFLLSIHLPFSAVGPKPPPKLLLFYNLQRCNLQLFFLKGKKVFLKDTPCFKKKFTI